MGQRLKESNEVQSPIAFLHEQVHCYNLVLEKIFLSTLHAGSSISHDSKLEIRNRSREIAKRLEKNPAFQFEAQNARVLSDHLETPSQKVTETLSALFALESVYQEASTDIRSLLLESLTLKQRLDQLKSFFCPKVQLNLKK